MSNSCERLQKLLRKKIYKELQDYKRELLHGSNRRVMDNAYAIVCMISIYEELQELIEQMNLETLKALTETPDLLKFFYSGWLDTEDSFNEEIRDSIISQVSIAREYARRVRTGYETFNKHCKTG